MSPEYNDPITSDCIIFDSCIGNQRRSKRIPIKKLKVESVNKDATWKVKDISLHGICLKGVLEKNGKELRKGNSIRASINFKKLSGIDKTHQVILEIVRVLRVKSLFFNSNLIGCNFIDIKEDCVNEIIKLYKLFNIEEPKVNNNRI